MSQFVESRYKEFTSGATLPAHARVKIDTGVLVAAGINDANAIGTTRVASVSGDSVTVTLFAPSVKMRAAAAIVAGAIVFTAADGEVSVSASTAFPTGIALEAAGADQQIIEVLPWIGETVVA